MKKRYNCKDNDNHILLIKEENVEENELELWFGDELEREWLVIGVRDLKDAIRKFNIKV